MNGLGHPHRTLYWYVRELGACAAALDADLTKVDELISGMEGIFMSMTMQQISGMKEELMPACRALEQNLRLLSEDLQKKLEAFDRFDDDIASAFRE